jgi:hypothetical protein
MAGEGFLGVPTVDAMLPEVEMAIKAGRGELGAVGVVAEVGELDGVGECPEVLDGGVGHCWVEGGE